MCAFRFFLQRFVPNARTLTDAETKNFISAADDDSDGRIGVEGQYLISHIVLVLKKNKKQISMQAEMISLDGLNVSWCK